MLIIISIYTNGIPRPVSITPSDTLMLLIVRNEMFVCLAVQTARVYILLRFLGWISLDVGVLAGQLE